MASLYRSFLRAGSAFPDYNVRDYVLRRTRQEFRRNRALTGPALAAALQHAAEQLAVVQRQSVVAGFYRGEPSVMETLATTEKKRGGGAGKAGAAGGVVQSSGEGAPVEEM